MRTSRLPQFASQAPKRQSRNTGFASLVHMITLSGTAVFIAQTFLS